MTDDSNALADELDARLADADAALAATYPGDRGRRQPVHTVYVPADRYDSGTVAAGPRRRGRRWPPTAGPRRSWPKRSTCSPRSPSRSTSGSAASWTPRPIEDLRIDFEDGYGIRPDEDEDAAAVAAAQALAASIAAGDAAPFHGIRVKSFEAPTRRRGVRTLQLFVRTLVEAGGLTDGFVITLPEGDLGRAGRGVRVRAREAGGGMLARARRAALRDPGGNPAGDPGRRRHCARSHA